MVTVRTFISYVGKTDLPNGQIHHRSPEVNSSRVSFYLQVKNSGKVILLISAPKVLNLNFLERKFKKARCTGI